MDSKITRSALAVAIGFVMLGMLAAPASAGPENTNRQVRGVALFVDTVDCFGLDLQPQEDGWGLDGCLSVLTVDDSRLSEGGVYKEYGTERFVGDLVYSEGGDSTVMASGTFDTTYVITSKWAGEPFASEQFHGRCQHPITSGTGDFEGATGRIDFKDTIVDGVAVEFPVFGHIRLAS